MVVSTPFQAQAQERSAPQHGAPAPQLLLRGEYIFTNVPGGMPNSGFNGAASPPATLIFLEDFQISGSTGCNRLSTRLFSAARSNRIFGPVATTKMACFGPARELEKRVLRALQLTSRLHRSAQSLTLLDNRGRVIARLRSINARVDSPTETGPGLYGKTWNLVSLDGNRIAPNAPTPTLIFDGQDGRVHGSTGCNNFGATHVRTNGKSRFGQAMQTERACMSPFGDPMATEAAYMRSLMQVSTIEVTASTLVLTSADGQHRLVFESAQ